MATAKKDGKGAPASAGQVRQAKKLTRKEKSVARKALYKQVRDEFAASRPQVKRGAHTGLPTVIRIDGQPRPEEYDEVLAKRICMMFATDPEMSLSGLNADPTMPTVWTFYEWLDSHSDLYKNYTRAREIQADVQAEALKDTAANALRGVTTTRRQVVTKDGDVIDLEEERVQDNVERAKLMVTTQQWLLSKIRPKKYGAQPLELENNDSLKDLLGAFRRRSEELDKDGS
jgi:hypothetical protein